MRAKLVKSVVLELSTGFQTKQTEFRRLSNLNYLNLIRSEMKVNLRITKFTNSVFCWADSNTH